MRAGNHIIGTQIHNIQNNRVKRVIYFYLLFAYVVRTQS